MIKQFAFENFCSFKEGGSISFELMGTVPEDVSNGNKLSTAIGIKGANGSGKTNILKALEFLFRFIKDSMNYKEGEEIWVMNFLNNAEPTKFYISLCISKVDYEYELHLNKERVILESLSVKPIDKSRKIVFLRNYDEIIRSSKDYSELKKLKLKKNTSILNYIEHFNFVSDMSEVKNLMTWTRTVISNVNALTGRMESDNDIVDDSFISRVYKDSKPVFDLMKQIIISSDMGIDDIEIFERPSKNDSNEMEYYPVFFCEHDGHTHQLLLIDQSSGTVALYRQLFLYAWVLHSGGVLILDEFDRHLHSLILPKLVSLFTSEETNIHGAQFIFTAHNTEIIDFLGKYRTILVGKENKESYCYRLDELSGQLVRNDRKIAQLYLDGRIGGIPNL
jgi:hypothetical protein